MIIREQSSMSSPLRMDREAQRAQAARRRRMRTPQVEPLEERRLLATMLWSNPTGGSWGTGTNWVNQGNSLDHHVPNSTDDAVVNTSGITIAHSTGSDTVKS